MHVLENRLYRPQIMHRRNALPVCGKICLWLPKNKYHFSVSYRKLWKWFLYMCFDTYLMRGSGVEKSKSSLNTCMFFRQSSSSTALGSKVFLGGANRLTWKQAENSQCLCLAEFILFHIATCLENRSLQCVQVRKSESCSPLPEGLTSTGSCNQRGENEKTCVWRCETRHLFVNSCDRTPSKCPRKENFLRVEWQWTSLLYQTWWKYLSSVFSHSYCSQ